MLKYKSYSTEDLFAELRYITDRLETLNLSRDEYNKLKRDEEEIKKELRSRGFNFRFW